MWIPYGLLGPLKAESAPETVRSSAADKAEREFLVGFFVRNPVTQAWEVDVLLSEGSHSESLELNGAAAVMSLFPNDAGKLDEIIYRVTATGAEPALDACYGHVNEQLASWAIRLGRGMALAGWRIADLKHEARWRCVPFRPSALELKQPIIEAAPESHQHLMKLYREARNATAPAWRFLCATAILKAWHDREEPFAATDTAAREVGKSRREHTVSFELLMHSGTATSVSELRDRPFGELVEYLEPLRQEALKEISGSYIGTHSADRRTAAFQAELANLADVCAREVLMEELSLYRMTAEAKGLALAPETA